MDQYLKNALVLAYHRNESLLPLCKNIQMWVPFLITFELIVLVEISPQG